MMITPKSIQELVTEDFARRAHLSGTDRYVATEAATLASSAA